MYQTSHQGCGYSCGGGLEKLTYSACSSSSGCSYSLDSSSGVFYSASAGPTFDYSQVSPVEKLANSVQHMAEEPLSNQVSYRTNDAEYQLFKTQPEYHFTPDDFLVPCKESIFVGKAEEIKEDIESAFEKIFDRPFPNDIKISVLNEKEFKKLAPAPGIRGLSINRSEHGLLSEIFVLNDTLGRIMLTIGHELGHVLTPTLGKALDEEAKAYAFSLIWMKTIKEHNICNLAEAIILENPARNGLHNVSFEFVHQQKELGKKEWEIYEKIIKGDLAVSMC